MPHAERVISLVAGLALVGLPGCVNDKPADQPTSLSGQDGVQPNQEPPQETPPPAPQAPPRQSTRQLSLSGPQAGSPGSSAPIVAAQPSSPQGASPPAPAGAPSPLPDIPVDPGLLRQIGSASLAVLSPGGVAGDPIEGGIKAASARYAPNMQPEGQMAKDSMQENAHKEMLVTLTGGKCYTIIGFSPAGQIRNLDLHLLSPPFYNVQAGQDDTVDGTPAIGKGANPICPLTPFLLQYKLDIHAQKGSGPFGVQVFSRIK
ncbi:MAG TPA: hypothetical protein VNO21_15960 [Polyangiaceae bacterium]|nr:hypothetical protein [Polyangiaceae bacterium]